MPAPLFPHPSNHRTTGSRQVGACRQQLPQRWRRSEPGPRRPELLCLRQPGRKLSYYDHWYSDCTSGELFMVETKRAVKDRNNVTKSPIRPGTTFEKLALQKKYQCSDEYWIGLPEGISRMTPKKIPHKRGWEVQIYFLKLVGNGPRDKIEQDKFLVSPSHLERDSSVFP